MSGLPHYSINDGGANASFLLGRIGHEIFQQPFFASPYYHSRGQILTTVIGGDGKIVGKPGEAHVLAVSVKSLPQNVVVCFGKLFVLPEFFESEPVGFYVPIAGKPVTVGGWVSNH